VIHSIKESLKKINIWFLLREKELFITIIVIFLPLLILGIIRLSFIELGRIPVGVFLGEEKSEVNIGDLKQTGLLVGSKKGVKYHFPWCSGAQRIKEENKVWFSSKKDAELGGYSPAGNCPGL